MSRTTVEIIREATALKYEERAYIVDELLATLETENDNDIDVAWIAEVERRDAEIENNGRTDSWAEVKRKAHSTTNV